MKRLLLNTIIAMMAFSLTGQSQNLGLVTGRSDFVGLSGYPSSPQLVESGADNFYWISGSSFATVYHPYLKEVVNNFANIYFLKYDKAGEIVGSNFVRGSSYAIEAASVEEGLTMVSRASYDVDASGTVLTLNGAYNLEFIAKYDPRCVLEKIVKIWNLGPSESAYSMAKVDRYDGSVYIYGTASQVMEVEGFGVIGKAHPESYLYLLKYGADLQLQWVYTAGFNTTLLAYGYYNNLKVTPDIKGNVVITGSYETDCNPLFDDVTLDSFKDGYGLFAAKLDPSGKQVWVQGGSMNGLGYATHIFKGLAMKNGDLVMAGVTTTGYFKLGDAEVNFVNGAGYTNQFIYRMTPEGTIRWLRPFQNMGPNYAEGKKGTGSINQLKGVESEEFTEDMYYDALEWNNRVLYMTGLFLNNTFNVAGKVLPKTYPEGAFVVAVDLGSGDELWGYGISSDFMGLHGFDADGSGNVSLMGYSSEIQDFESIAVEPVNGTYPVFHLGLDYNGKPLWHNNAHILTGPGYNLNGVDLEVLRDGQVFSSMYLSRTDNLIIGGSSLFEDYPYTSWLLALNATSEIGGTVTDPAGNPLFPGYVKAYKSARSGAYPAVDSVELDGGGNYLFKGLYPGNYTLKVFPDPVSYPKAIPTYLENVVEWKVAGFNDFKVDTRAGFLNIMATEVEPLNPENGSGNLSGNLSYEEDGTLKGTQARPVSKGPVILTKRSKKSTNAGEVVAYVETDQFGNFAFENVPDGDYLLIVDVTGLEMIETHEVTIAGNQIVSGLDYTVGPDGIYTWTGVGIRDREQGQLGMFPNPGDGLITLGFPGKGTYRAYVYGTDGKLAASRVFFSSSAETTLDITNLKKGIYMIRVEGPDLSASVKYLKR